MSPYYGDTKDWPPCSHQECGADSFGPYHGTNCARSRFAAEQLAAWESNAPFALEAGVKPE